MICPKCHTENPEGMSFCSKCGISLPKVCPNCGNSAVQEDNFCGKCGHELQETRSIEKLVPELEGERKHITVLFSDLSGYTAMSERLDPEEVKDVMNEVFRGIAAIIAKYDGSIEKFIGDAVVAFFGVPKVHEDDDVRALKAAREIHSGVNTFGIDYEKKTGKRLAFHTGIATGLIVTGEANVDKGTLVGDTINLASRLSSIAKPGEILVGEGTYLQSKGTFSFERLQPVSVKGKAEPVTSYRLLEVKAGPAKGPAAKGISSPLVGRNAELAAIKGCVNRLLKNQGGILSIIGEAGLGKSRLMAEIHRYFAHEHVLWLEGHTLSYGQKMSYWPFKEILWHYAGVTEDNSDTEVWEKFEKKITDLFPAESDDIIPYLASLIGLEVKGDLAKNLKYLDGESMRKQIYLSSRRFFERVAQTPLVLVFEDLHWADESTVALIAHLFPLINRVPILICGVSRPEAGASAARLRDAALTDHEKRYTEIRLGPLSSAECTDLMNNLLTIEQLPSRTRQLILQRADGNPFFLEEIMRTLIDRGKVHSENGHWKATSQIETITIPDTIQGVIMARIDRLDEELKQVLKTASVIGRAFLYRLLREVTETVRDLDRDLDALTATELIRQKQKVPELEYIFKHALVQESTYESILLKKRHELHDKVASAIETLFSDRLDEFSSVLAYHYAKAESWEKAQEYLFKAGDQAGKIAADAEVLTHYQQALETYTKVFGDKWDPIQRGILERKMGEAFYRKGEYETAMEYLQGALVYFGRPRLPTSMGKVLFETLKEIGIQVSHRLCSRWLAKKRSGATDPMVEEVVRIYDDVVSISAVIAPATILHSSLICLNYCDRKGNVTGIATMYGNLGFTAHLLSFARLERSLLKHAMIMAVEEVQPATWSTLHMVSVISMISSMTEFNEGRLRGAIDHGSKARDVCRKMFCPDIVTWGTATLFTAMAHVFLTNFDISLSLSNELIRMGEDTNDLSLYGAGLWPLSEVQDKQGRFEDCIANSKKLIEAFEAIKFHNGRVVGGYVLGRCYLRLGEIDAGLDILIQNDTYRIDHDSRLEEHFVLLGVFRAYLAVAERANAMDRERWMKKAKQAKKKALHSAQLRRIILPEATRLQGVYDWLNGKQAAAQKHWQHSISLAEEMGMRYELAMTHLEMGMRLNDHDHLKQAEATFADIGADFDLAEARRLLQSLAERKGGVA